MRTCDSRIKFWHCDEADVGDLIREYRTALLAHCLLVIVLGKTKGKKVVSNPSETNYTTFASPHIASGSELSPLYYSTSFPPRISAVLRRLLNIRRYAQGTLTLPALFAPATWTVITREVWSHTSIFSHLARLAVNCDNVLGIFSEVCVNAERNDCVNAKTLGIRATWHKTWAKDPMHRDCDHQMESARQAGNELLGRTPGRCSSAIRIKYSAMNSYPLGAQIINFKVAVVSGCKKTLYLR